MGVRCRHRSITPLATSSVAKDECTMPTFMTPGAMALMRTFCWPTSRASWRMMPMTAVLGMPDMPSFSNVRSTAVVRKWTMEPPPWAAKWRDTDVRTL